VSGSPVVLVGSPRDGHIEAVAKGLADRGVDLVILDTLDFPDRPAIVLGERLDAITIDGSDLGHPAAVYVRDLYTQPLAVGVDVGDEMEQDWRRTLIALREKSHVLYSILGRWAELGVPCYNPMTADWRLTKPMQIALLERAGLPVPPTVWTNAPDAVRTFAADQEVAYKPVAGGAATRKLAPADLTDERLDTLRGAPVTFQKLLPGDNFRVYVLDGAVVATLRIASESLDYRQNEDVIEQVDLSETIRENCVAAAAALGLRWTGIDLKADADGRLQFLEANSSPMFLGFDRRSGSDILDALISVLAGHAG
jgi:glutathione synthase/RimK-type ligase-like ATP-grasp enzyme